MGADSREADAMRATVALYIVLFAAKFVVYFFTGVMVLLGEALHTLSDIFIFGFLLVATRYSRKAPDAVHMFGYGRAQNVAALVAATLFISFTSYKLYEEALPRLFQPQGGNVQHLGWALGIIVTSMVMVAAPTIGLLREKPKGATARAQLMSLINDELGLIAALVGTVLLWRGWPLADPIATIVVATIIAVDAVGLFRENVSLLLGRSPGREYLAKVESQARSVEGVLGIHELRAEYIGPDVVHAGMHIEVRPDLTVQEADQIAQEVRRRVHATLDSGFCVIHVDPAKPGAM